MIKQHLLSLTRNYIHWSTINAQPSQHSHHRMQGGMNCGSIQSSYLKLLMLWMCKFSPKRGQTGENKLKSFFFFLYVSLYCTAQIPYNREKFTWLSMRRVRWFLCVSEAAWLWSVR